MRTGGWDWPGLALGYNNTGSDAQGNYLLTQYGNDCWGGTPAMSGTMGGSPGPETAEVITAELNTAVGHSISVNGTTVASNANTSPIASSSGANFISYLGTGNGLPDEGFFNGDLGEVIIFNRALTSAEQAAAEAYLEYKWLGVGAPVAVPSFMTNPRARCLAPRR